MESRENPDLIKLKLIKVMKRKILMACTALVVSAAVVVGVKVYNYYSMPELMRANLEALSDKEHYIVDTSPCYVYNAHGEAMNTYACHDSTAMNKYYSCDEIKFFSVGIDSKCISKVQKY